MREATINTKGFIWGSHPLKVVKGVEDAEPRGMEVGIRPRSSDGRARPW
jgi:hypothetical protein